MRQFSREHVQMPLRHVKRGSALLATRKMKIQITMRHCYSQEWIKSVNTERWFRSGRSHTTTEKKNVKRFSHTGHQYHSSS